MSLILNPTRIEIALYTLLGVVLLIGDCHAAEPAQICQHGKCRVETDPQILACALQSCDVMAEGVYMCEPKICVDRPRVTDFKPSWSINVNLLSRHYGTPAKDSPVTEYNENNRGFGIEYEFSPGVYAALNKFENSFNEDTLALTLGTYVDRGDFVSLGFEAGLANGYRIAGDTLSAPKITDDIIFVGGIVVRVGGRVAIKTTIAPDFVGAQLQGSFGGRYGH